MKTSKKKSMVEPDELAQLTKQSVQRAIDAQSQQLSTDEIDQVTGGAVAFALPVAVIQRPVIVPAFPLGIYIRDLYGRIPTPGRFG